MTDSKQQSSSELCKAYQSLIASQKTLLLSTVTETNQPEISYAPYVRDEQGSFYIFISELASHTRNLLKNKNASIMFIKPESEVRELFARERITFNCDAIEIAPEDVVFEQQLYSFHRNFGEIVTLIKSLTDFHLFALRPVSGQYVVGFGKAFKINMTDGSLSGLGQT